MREKKESRKEESVQTSDQWIKEMCEPSPQPFGHGKLSVEKGDLNSQKTTERLSELPCGV